MEIVIIKEKKKTAQPLDCFVVYGPVQCNEWSESSKYILCPDNVPQTLQNNLNIIFYIYIMYLCCWLSGINDSSIGKASWKVENFTFCSFWKVDDIPCTQIIIYSLNYYVLYQIMVVWTCSDICPERYIYSKNTWNAQTTIKTSIFCSILLSENTDIWTERW